MQQTLFMCVSMEQMSPIPNGGDWSRGRRGSCLMGCVQAYGSPWWVQVSPSREKATRSPGGGGGARFFIGAMDKKFPRKRWGGGSTCGM